MDNNVPEDWTDRQEESAIEKAIEMSLSEPSSIKLPPSLKSRTMVLDVVYWHSEYWSLIDIEYVSANFVIAIAGTMIGCEDAWRCATHCTDRAD